MNKATRASTPSQPDDLITIIGAGNMGTSLAGGLAAKGYPSKNITITDISTQKLSDIKIRFDVQTSSDNMTAINSADVVLFAIKPQTFAATATELAATIQKQKPLIISIAAGITESSIQGWLGGAMPIVRCMPNTPALIGCGATALFANQYVSLKQRQLADTILSTVGITLWLDEEQLLDAVTALSGSGPAYFFLIIEALQQAGEKLGLTAEAARLLTLQTAYGAARMALESKCSITDLRAAVTSPGGTTEQAIKVLEKANIRAIMTDTVIAAQERAKELSKELG